MNIAVITAKKLLIRPNWESLYFLAESKYRGRFGKAIDDEKLLRYSQELVDVLLGLRRADFV